MLKATGEVGSSSEFNTHSYSEVIAYFSDWMDTTFMSDLNVQLPDGSWKDMKEAFRDKDIVPDNFNCYFGVPINEKCKARGYNP